MVGTIMSFTFIKKYSCIYATSICWVPTCAGAVVTNAISALKKEAENRPSGTLISDISAMIL